MEESAYDSIVLIEHKDKSFFLTQNLQKIRNNHQVRRGLLK